MPASIVDLVIHNAYRQIQCSVYSEQTLPTLHALITIGGSNLVKCGELAAFFSSEEVILPTGELQITVQYQDWFPMHRQWVDRIYPFLSEAYGD